MFVQLGHGAVALANRFGQVVHSLFANFIVDPAQRAPGRSACLRIVWLPFFDHVIHSLEEPIEFHTFHVGGVILRQ